LGLPTVGSADRRQPELSPAFREAGAFTRERSAPGRAQVRPVEALGRPGRTPA